jgi:chemotaxis family two-component system response regulator Rcp1
MADILLIEDNPGDILLTKEAFSECNGSHNFETVNDGIEAMKYLRKEGKYKIAPKPDLILLDLNLPRKDGREVLYEIKKDNDLKSIPVIILSTSKNEKDIHKTYELNANCYISKPVELEYFFKIISKLNHFWFKTVKLPEK